MFRIGERVKIKSKYELYELERNNYDPHIMGPMFNLADQVVTISRVEDYCDYYVYHIEEDGYGYYWGEHLFEQFYMGIDMPSNSRLMEFIKE